MSKQLRNPLSLYFSRHLQACLSSAGQLVRAPLTSLLTLTVIGIAIALPAGFFALLANIQHFSQNWHSDAQISLYLKKDVGSSKIQQLLQQLRQRSDIQTVKYISPQTGLAQFVKQSEFSDVLPALKNNPLPGVIEIQPNLQDTSTQATARLINQLKQIPDVDQAKSDMGWVKKFYAILALIKRAIIALALLLSLAVIFIVGNTIHLATQRYRNEIEIYQLVGATNSFIRRPFLYAGFWYGIGGGIIAWGIIELTLWCLSAPLDRLLLLYDNNFTYGNLSLSFSLTIITAAALLGLNGAWLTVNRHLKTTAGRNDF